jgi:hypothetical protein
MGVFGEKGKLARSHDVWAVAWISGGAMLAAYLPSPTNGSDLGASTKASLVDVRDTREAPPPEASEELVGLDGKRAIELLGSPMTTEDRAPASVWHYKSSRCGLELVFYMEMRTGLMRTLHYDFKSGAGNAAQRQACVIAIRQENLGAPGNKLPEKDILAEIPIGDEVRPALAEASIENDLPPASEPKQQLSRREPHVQRGYVRHRPHWYTARGGGWGYTLALRNYSGWSSGAAALTTGWGGGQFGPPPYSASGP